MINAGLKAITDDGTVDEIMGKRQGKRVLYVTEDYFKIFYLRATSFFSVFGGIDRDISARFGGEEFVVMLMNTTAKEAGSVAEETRTRVEELGIVTI